MPQMVFAEHILCFFEIDLQNFNCKLDTNDNERISQLKIYINRALYTWKREKF